MAKIGDKELQNRALREAKAISRVVLKPTGMRPLAVDFVPQKEITATVVPRPKTSTAAFGSTKRKVGRPRLGEGDKTLKAQQPWAAAGMSRSTWFRRQAEKRAKP